MVMHDLGVNFGIFFSFNSQIAYTTHTGTNLDICARVDRILDVDQPTVKSVVDGYLHEPVRGTFHGFPGTQKICADLMAMIPFGDKRPQNPCAVAVSNVDPSWCRNGDELVAVTPTTKTGRGRDPKAHEGRG